MEKRFSVHFQHFVQKTSEKHKLHYYVLSRAGKMMLSYRLNPLDSIGLDFTRLYNRARKLKRHMLLWKPSDSRIVASCDAQGKPCPVYLREGSLRHLKPLASCGTFPEGDYVLLYVKAEHFGSIWPIANIDTAKLKSLETYNAYAVSHVYRSYDTLRHTIGGIHQAALLKKVDDDSFIYAWKRFIKICSKYNYHWVVLKDVELMRRFPEGYELNMRIDPDTVLRYQMAGSLNRFEQSGPIKWLLAVREYNIDATLRYSNALRKQTQWPLNRELIPQLGVAYFKSLRWRCAAYPNICLDQIFSVMHKAAMGLCIFYPSYALILLRLVNMTEPGASTVGSIVKECWNSDAVFLYKQKCPSDWKRQAGCFAALSRDVGYDQKAYISQRSKFLDQIIFRALCMDFLLHPSLAVRILSHYRKGETMVSLSFERAADRKRLIQRGVILPLDDEGKDYMLIHKEIEKDHIPKQVKVFDEIFF